MSSAYTEIIVETYEAGPRGHHGEVRVRPVSGQIFPPSMNVECSKKMRYDYPVGTKFKIQVKVNRREDNGTEFLYSYFGWPFKVVPS